MKSLFTLLLLLYFPFAAVFAQRNLVPNGNFEYYGACPTATAQLGNITGWSNFQNTPDFFHSCGAIVVGMPSNKWGTENAVSGNGYVGASFYSRRESFTRAITPMVATRSYEVSLSISLADNSKYAVDGLGIFLKRGAAYYNSSRILIPQVDFSFAGPITEKTGWVRLTAYYVADSAYDNIVLGNFKDDSVLNIVSLSAGSIPHAYYYFDSIVIRAENLALRYRDTLLCAGDSLIVPYFVNSDSINAGNIFSLQLSDTSDSFVSGVTTLATVSGISSGIFRTVIPATIAAGYHYRIRVVSSSKPLTSRTNGKDIAIGAFRPNKPVAASNGPVCTADSLRLSATTTSTGTFTWRWEGPNNFISTAQNPVMGNPINTSAGNYRVTVYNYGCIARDTTSVLVKTSPAAIVASSNSSVCEQDTLKLYSTASSSGVTYSWSGPDSFSSSILHPVILNASVTNGGKYYIVATASNGCYRKDSVVANVKPKPFVAASSNGPVCVQSSLSLSANTAVNGASFTWSGPVGYMSASQYPAVSSVTTANAGLYTVTASLNGCTDTGITTVVINSRPSLSTASNSPVCLLDTIKLLSTASAGVSYNWTGPGSYSATVANPFIALAATANDGKYMLTVTDTNGCTRTDSVNVTMKALPESYASNTSPVCAGTSFGLSATTSYMGVSFVWTGPNGFSATSVSPTVNNAQVVAGGTYVLTATMNGCSYTAVTNATVHAIPVAHASAQLPVCLGSTIQLLGNSYPAATYQWSGPSYSSTFQSPAMAASSAGQSGNYVLIVTANGCVSKPDTVFVKINALPVIGGYVSPNDTICKGTSPTFVAFVQNGGPAPVAQWYKNNVPVGIPNSLKYKPQVVDSGDIYYCKLIAPGVCYTTLMMSTDTVKMAVLPVVTRPEVEITANPGFSVRPSDNVRFTAHVKYGGARPQYQWYRNGIKQTGAKQAIFDAIGLVSKDVIQVDVVSDDLCVLDKAASDSVWMQNPTAITNITSGDISLYPNPSNGNFIVSGIEVTEANVEIVNAVGQTVYHHSTTVINGSVAIASRLLPGNYALRLSFGNEVRTLRVSVY